MKKHRNFSMLFTMAVIGHMFGFNAFKLRPKVAKEWKPEFTYFELKHVRDLRENVSKRASELEVKRLRNKYLQSSVV